MYDREQSHDAVRDPKIVRFVYIRETIAERAEHAESNLRSRLQTLDKIN